jgi:hypothetical protein
MYKEVIDYVLSKKSYMVFTQSATSGAKPPKTFNTWKTAKSSELFK